MNLLRLIAIVASCSISAGCSTQTTLGWEEKLANINIKKCLNNGGSIRQAGILGYPTCITPYQDADKLCSSSSQCEGRCLAEDIGSLEGGKCEYDDSPFGCYVIIENATKGEYISICVD